MKQEMKGWLWHQLDYIRIICTCRETVDFVEIYQYCANWCGAFWDDCQRLLLQLALSSANGVSDQTRREFVQPPDSHQLASVGGGQYWMPKVTVFVIFIHWWGLLKYVWIVGADCLWIERCCSSLVSGISEITKCCATDIMGLCGTMSMFCAFVHQIYFYLVCYFVKGCKILWWVYLFISLFTHISQKPHGHTSPVCFVDVTCGRGSVLFWQRCNMQYSFVDDIMFSPSGPSGASCVCL